MFRIVAVIAALLVSALLRDAGAEALRKWTVGSWEVSQHDSYCMATSPSLMAGKTSLMFSMGGDGVLAALLANPTWQMKGSRVNEVRVAVDRSELGSHPTKVIGPTVVAVALPTALIPELRDGVRATFEFERAAYTFPLRHTQLGLVALEKCFQGAMETASTEKAPE